VLQVFADKKHNRRQTTALYQGLHYQTIDGVGHTSAMPVGGAMTKQNTANSDIPFVLTQYKSSVGKDSQRSISARDSHR